MSVSKPSSRSSSVKKDGSFRYATRLLALEKGRRANLSKDSNAMKACECLLKSDGWKASKHSQNSKHPIKKVNTNKCVNKDGRNKITSTNRHEKVVIVSKRSSSVSVVKSCSLRKSVSVKKVSYSTSVVLSSDEDSDSEEELEDDEKNEYSRKKKTILKHTTSKVKSRYRQPKKSETRAAKKAKAIKLLCEKLSSNKNKSVSPVRELRPRFPYSMLQEWPTARAHRMASLNALAKVHVLYENEGRTTGENLNDADECSLIDFLNEENSDDEIEEKKEIRPVVNANVKKNEKIKNSECDKIKNDKKGKTSTIDQKISRKGRKRKISDVEIIDTKVCKRMASLNAQAILAASYLQEPKPRKVSKKLEKCDSSSDIDVKEIIMESNCDLEIIEDEKNDNSVKTKETNSHSEEHRNENQNPSHEASKENKNTSIPVASNVSASEASYANWTVESDIAVADNNQEDIVPCNIEKNIVSSTATTKVGVTQYTEVTKVHINTRKDMEIKEESKAERKIERILANDDVAITQMYHYQSKNANESYCLQMQTTYKPASKNLTPPTISLSNNPMHPHINEPVLPSRQNYYGHSPMLSPQPYHMDPNVNPIPPPVMGMDHRLSHQYGGSAFTVPHYRHPQQLQFPRGDYGYYQPAGPLIQPLHDQYTIHKPVPYHPQPHLHQSPQRPHPPSSCLDVYQNRDSHSVRRNGSPVISPHHSAVSHKLNPAMPLRPSIPETSPQQSQSSLQYGHRQSSERAPDNNMNSGSRHFPKSVSSPLHSSYSSQNNYRGYNQQKPVSNSTGNFPKPYDQKVQFQKHNGRSSGPTGPVNVSHHKDKTYSQSSHSAYGNAGSQNSNSVNFPQSMEVSRSSHALSSHPESSLKNVNNVMQYKDSTWDIKSSHAHMPETPVSFLPYQNEPNKEMPSVNIPETVKYPLRPPSVIEIVEDNTRDTKTYIQLEVPKNSHREKIVVVDIENDDLERKFDSLKSTEKNKPTLNVTQEQNAVKQQEEIAVKEEAKSEDKANLVKAPEQKQCDEINKDMPDIMVIEVKKKKESAVVRRARLHGKQRTFRDCYNRPLAPLTKVKKNENITASEDHLKKNLQPLVSLPRLVLPKASEKKPTHGWCWEGSPFEQLVYLSNDDPPCIRRCYPSMRHIEGDVICVRDCVFLRSGPRKTDLPFVSKITALWDNPVDGEMMMSLLWYYRPEHTETGKKIYHMDDEIFASKHRDINSVACIEDKCYVLTYLEYCRYRRKCKLAEDNLASPSSVVPEVDDYPREKRLPPVNISPDLVLFCKKVYDYRQKRLLKNPV